MLPRTLMPYELKSIHKISKQNIYIREVLQSPSHLNRMEGCEVDSSGWGYGPAGGSYGDCMNLTVNTMSVGSIRNKLPKRVTSC